MLSRVRLCHPMDCSPQGSSVHGILQARVLQWVATPSSRGASSPGIKSPSPKSPALAGGFFTTSATWEAPKGDKVTAEHLVWSLIMRSLRSALVLLGGGVKPRLDDVKPRGAGSSPARKCHLSCATFPETPDTGRLWTSLTPCRHVIQILSRDPWWHLSFPCYCLIAKLQSSPSADNLHGGNYCKALKGVSSPLKIHRVQ